MTVTLTPTDLPRLRDDMVEFNGTPPAFGLRAMDIQEGRLPRGSAPTVRAAAASWIAAEGQALADADLIYVTADMCELAATAARSLPSFNLLAEDIPCRSGLAYFANPLTDADEGGRPVEIRAVCWAVVGEAVVVLTCVDRDEYAPDWAVDARRLGQFLPATFQLGCWFAEFGLQDAMVRTRMDGPETPFMDAIGKIPGALMLATIKTLWLLMAQPIVEETAEQPDRPTRRRLQREGRPVPPIRVINLRRPPSHGGASGESGREYHVRWIVRGHWRNVRWGPGRELRRPVWVAPFLKGNPDAPLIGGEKVYLVSDRKPVEATS